MASLDVRLVKMERLRRADDECRQAQAQPAAAPATFDPETRARVSGRGTAA